jgi:hypothetical protein
MSTRARGPRILKGALVAIDPTNPTPKIIAFYYNPTNLRRTLQPQMSGGEEGDRSQAVRFTGAPVETITVDIEIDGTDLLEAGDAVTTEMGIYPQLSALELLAYPSSNQVNQTQSLLAQGTIEVAPMTSPRVLFVWGSKRGLPVRITSYNITEEAFDGNLNPIRATVSLSMRILNYTDLSASSPDYHQFLSYQQSLEAMAPYATLSNARTIIGVNPASF